MVKQGEAFHFYKKSSLPADARGDVQQLDIGIALAHFMLVLDEHGVKGSVTQADPGLQHAADTAYQLTWTRDA